MLSNLPRSLRIARSPFRPAPHAMGVICLLGFTACASASGDTPDIATPTRTTLSVSGPGTRGSLDLTNDASLIKVTVPVPPTQAWSVLPSVFEQLEVPVALSDPSSRLMGNEGYRARRIEGNLLSRYVDCGSGFSGPLADTYDVTLTVLTQLRDLDGRGTEVTTLVDAYARARATSGNSFHCTSKQVLERRVGELVRERIVGG